MSEYWDLGCVDCDETYGMWVRNDEEAIQDIIDVAPALIAAEKVAGFPLLLDNDMFNLSSERTSRLNTFWLTKHAGHRLAPRSEYGYYAPDCDKKVACSHCGASNRCKLLRDHEGVCKNQEVEK